MAEYYAVLKKAVAGLHPNAHDARRSVYDKARAALVGQLKAINPPLSTSEISRQRLELEEAIRRVERESSQGYSAPSESRRVAYEPPGGDDDFEPYEDEPAISEESFAEDVFNQALDEIERQNHEPAETEPRRRGRSNVPTRYERPEPETYDYEPEPPDRYEPEPEPERFDRGPRLPAAGRDMRAPAEPGPAPDFHAGAGYHDDRDMRWDEPPRGRGRGDTHDLIGRPARRSPLPRILLTVLVLAIVGGIGAVAWTQRGVVGEIMADLNLPFLGGGQNSAGSQPSGDAQTAAKDDDRLLDGGGGAASPQRPDASASVQPGPGTTAGSPSEGSAIVAQRSFLYEEGSGGSDSVATLAGNVVWRFAESEANGPTVQASIEVPDRSLKVRIIMRKNVDASLPASHLIEIFVDAPSNFPGGSVESVLDLLPKASEEAQGKKLAAATAKVADGFFWIALADDGQSVLANIALLREGAWFDMPVVYQNGQRAILTFEKGEPGRRVFDQALAAWGN